MNNEIYIDYEEEDDILHIHFGYPQACKTSEVDQNIFIRRTPEGILSAIEIWYCKDQIKFDKNNFKDETVMVRTPGQKAYNELRIRCQKAEKAAKQNVEACRQQGISFGRILANYAANKTVEILKRLATAAEAYSADQSAAKDKRCGLTQPITVDEANELNEALKAAWEYIDAVTPKEWRPEGK